MSENAESFFSLPIVHENILGNDSDGLGKCNDVENRLTCKPWPVCVYHLFIGL